MSNLNILNLEGDENNNKYFIKFNIRDKISVTIDMFSKITNTNIMHKNIKQH